MTPHEIASRLRALAAEIEGAPAPTPPPTPVPPPPPVTPAPSGTTTTAAHLANVIALYNRDTRGRFLSAAYLEIHPALMYKSRLEPLIRDALFGGSQAALAHWADKGSFVPPPYNGALSTGEFLSLQAMALSADALPG